MWIRVKNLRKILDFIQFSYCNVRSLMPCSTYSSYCLWHCEGSLNSSSNQLKTWGEAWITRATKLSPIMKFMETANKGILLHKILFRSYFPRFLQERFMENILLYLIEKLDNALDALQLFCDSRTQICQSLEQIFWRTHNKVSTNLCGALGPTAAVHRRCWFPGNMFHLTLLFSEKFALFLHRSLPRGSRQ